LDHQEYPDNNRAEASAAVGGDENSKVWWPAPCGRLLSRPVAVENSDLSGLRTVGMASSSAGLANQPSAEGCRNHPNSSD